MIETLLLVNISVNDTAGNTHAKRSSGSLSKHSQILTWYAFLFICNQHCGWHVLVSEPCLHFPSTHFHDIGLQERRGKGHLI